MYIRWACAAALLLLSGCVTITPMAFDKTSKSIDVSSKSIVLMTLDVSRNDDSRYVPRPMTVFWKAHASSPETVYRFRTLEPGELAAIPEHHQYALRMALEPGQYELTQVSGLASAFPFNGIFFVPLFLDLTVPAHSVVYVGHVSAELRERKDGEYRAGPLIPLIDQAATGMSGGTWEVKIDDASATDLAMFRETFPALTDVPIATAILPQYDRLAVQRKWDGKVDSPSQGPASKGP